MGRGKALRTRVKEAKKLAEAEALGTAIGEQKGHKKKKLEQSLREHLGKLIDRIDPLKTLGLAATTFVCYTLIKQNKTLLETALRWADPVAQLGSPVFFLLRQFQIVPSPYEESAEWLEKQPDYFIWILALAIAYLLVEHGDALLGDSGIEGFVAMLIGG